MAVGKIQNSGTRNIHGTFIPFRGSEDGFLKAIGTASETTHCSKCEFFNKAKPRNLVASFFCCTFAADLKKSSLISAGSYPAIKMRK